jgi:thymidylate kinase
MSQSGLIIVFEGPDNSGKSTQINKLLNCLLQKLSEKEKNEQCLLGKPMIKFPQYNTMYGEMINEMLHNTRDYDIVHNLKDMEKFSYLQLQDKLDTVKKIYAILKLYPYVLLDRYTLSSRIYDAASRFLLKNTLVMDSSNFEESNKDLLDNFLNNWIFSSVYHSSYFETLFENAFFILENPLFNFYHIIFKSSFILNEKAKREKNLDNYEKESPFKILVDWTYDNITKKDNRFFEDNKYMVVDTDKLIGDNIKDPFGYNWNDEKLIDIVHEYIVNELKKLKIKTEVPLLDL